MYRPKSKVKSIGNVMQWYRQQSGTIGAKIPELEALKPFFGKRGGLYQRNLRSKRQQAKFEKAIADFKKKYGARPNKKKIEKALQEQRKKDQERLKKARKTFRENQKKKAAEEAAARGEKVDFRKVAREANKRYSRLVEAFTDETLSKLMQQYDIGSPIIQWMEEQGLTVAEMCQLITLIMSTFNDLPEEARELAQQDDFWSIGLEIMQFESEEMQDFGYIFKAYIEELGSGTKEEFMDLLREYDESGSNVPFADVWEELKTYTDPYNPNNMYEVLQNFEEGEE